MKTGNEMDFPHSGESKSSQISDPPEVKKTKPRPPLESFQLLKAYESNVKCLKRRKLNEQIVISSDLPSNSSSSWEQLSTGSIMKIARTRLLQDKGLIANSTLPNLRFKVFEDNDVHELALLLQASAENVANLKYDRVRKLLTMCRQSASMNGNPVQRIAYYFADALQKRVDQETGKFSSGLAGNNGKPMDTEKVLARLHPAIIRCAQKLPFTQVTQFAGVQAILDAVASAKRIHLIDLGIKYGSQWTIIMQALAVRHECAIDLLKITAVGTSEKRLEETGKWLSSFADTMNLPFSFKTVVSDLKDLKEDSFELNAGEVVAVYSDQRLWSLLAWTSHLESLLENLKKLKPRVMVVIEAEANTHVPNFSDRFNETLVFCSSMFDCLEACMDRDNPFRSLSEGEYLREMIQNIVTKEGEERIHRHQKIKH
ncbi:hypothetical protein ACH5RR_031020 [Cinchona calisaya]|uniref:Uncharacterized protein n=1 Tax=Cinchona calisaya TaxID=153742 RepID=A0ABD2YJA7_9GENT